VYYGFPEGIKEMPNSQAHTFLLKVSVRQSIEIPNLQNSVETYESTQSCSGDITSLMLPRCPDSECILKLDV